MEITLNQSSKYWHCFLTKKESEKIRCFKCLKPIDHALIFYVCESQGLTSCQDCELGSEQLIQGCSIERVKYGEHIHTCIKHCEIQA